MYWIKNHRQRMELVPRGEWLCSNWFLIKTHRVGKTLYYKKSIPNPVPDGFTADKFQNAEDIFPVLDKVIVNDGPQIPDTVVWNLTSMDGDGNPRMYKADATLIGWVLYHLGYKNGGDELDWMISNSLMALYLYEDGELLAVIMLLRVFNDELE